MRFFYWAFTTFAAYLLGFWDGRKGRPPEPLRGNYEHCEDPDEEDRGDYDF